MLADLSLSLLDIAQNSVAADARNIGIAVKSDAAGDTLTLRVTDDGRGMSEAFASAVTSPFVTTRATRKVGLGIPMFKAGAEMTGGRFELTTAPGEGTTVTAVYGLSHIDRPPLGDIADTFASLVLTCPGVEFTLEVAGPGGEFTVGTAELKRILGGVPVGSPEVIAWLREYARGGVASTGVR